MGEKESCGILLIELCLELTRQELAKRIANEKKNNLM